MKVRRTAAPYISLVALAVFLLAVGGLGYLAFLAFIKGVLKPQELASYGLVFTTVAAATASFFSPCSFTVLPSYIAFASSGKDMGPGKRLHYALKSGLVATLGVVTVVAVFGCLDRGPRDRNRLRPIHYRIRPQLPG